jgi:hypothetical protein
MLAKFAGRRGGACCAPAPGDGETSDGKSKSKIKAQRANLTISGKRVR